MKKIIFLLSILFTVNISAQRVFTRNGHVYFISHTDIIDIDGNNHQVTSFLDIETGEIVFAVLIKAFEFTLATAEEHFNESYMESHLHPKSKLTGKIIEINDIDLTKPGIYDVTVEGELTIHGITKNIKEKGQLEVKGDRISGTSCFKVAIADYNIKVPKLVEDRVAKVVDVRINLEYEPYIKQ